MTNTNNTTTSDLNTSHSNYSVDAKQVDNVGLRGNTWDSPNWTKYHGYYKQIPELKKAIDALATWTVGKGYVSDNRTKVSLRRMNGWGEDTFQAIMENMIIIKKVNGDAFAEIIKNEKGTLLNIKPLNPSSIRIHVNDKGLITHYEQIDRLTKNSKKRFEKNEILHISNDRIADEIHGVSVVEACQWVIDARNESMTDWRKVLHRNINPLKIFKMDTDNAAKISNFKSQYENMTKDYEALFVPKDSVDVEIPTIPLQNPIEWIRYLESFFYQAVGVPKIILGGSQDFTEASSKIGYLTFEPVYVREQTLLEADLFAQLGISVTFNRPASLGGVIQSDESKNTGQTGFQANEVTAQAGRVE